uniref:Uncharacterized protein n=1 Tax=Rhizophora mucronata TaxID=61149 RepID=A0A2P2QNR7_RHIMU
MFVPKKKPHKLIHKEIRPQRSGTDKSWTGF